MQSTCGIAWRAVDWISGESVRSRASSAFRSGEALRAVERVARASGPTCSDGRARRSAARPAGAPPARPARAVPSPARPGAGCGRRGAWSCGRARTWSARGRVSAARRPRSARRPSAWWPRGRQPPGAGVGAVRGVDDRVGGAHERLECPRLVGQVLNGRAVCSSAPGAAQRSRADSGSRSPSAIPTSPGSA